MTLRGGPLLVSTPTTGSEKTVLIEYIGIGLCGLVVSQETSQTTLRLRLGDSRLSLETKGGIGSER